jgi:hypothetical protein
MSAKSKQRNQLATFVDTSIAENGGVRERHVSGAITAAGMRRIAMARTAMKSKE